MRWSVIEEFPYYRVSDEGHIYNDRFERFMKLSKTLDGHLKVTLTTTEGERLTRSVALLVAEAFVEPPNGLSDHVVCLDGDIENVRADNLVWRPSGFAWKYVRQLKERQPHYIINLPVRDITTNTEYPSIYEAGVDQGLLFEDIWHSTHRGTTVFPNASIFEVIH